MSPLTVPCKHSIVGDEGPTHSYDLEKAFLFLIYV